MIEYDKHIFLVFHNFGLGGIQRKMVDITNYLASSKDIGLNSIKCHLVVREKSTFSFENQLHNPNCFFHYFRTFPFPINRLKNIFYHFHLLYLIIKYKPRVVYSFLHFNLPSLISIKFLLSPFIKFKLVMSQDNILSFYNQRPHVKKLFPNRLISRLYKFTDVILVQTEYAKNDLIKNFGINATKIKVIQNWVVGLKPKKRQKKYDIIYCGRFAKQKRLERLLAITKILVQKRSGIKVLMVGAGDEEEKLQKLVFKWNLSNNVQILPPTHEIKKYLEESKIFVLTSDFEGHPMVLLEAMALGVVPAILDYPGCKEYLEDGRDSCVRKTQKELAHAIENLLSHADLRRKLSLRAQKRVLKNNNNELINKMLAAAELFN